MPFRHAYRRRSSERTREPSGILLGGGCLQGHVWGMDLLLFHLLTSATYRVGSFSDTILKSGQGVGDLARLRETSYLLQRTSGFTLARGIPYEVIMHAI